MKIIAKATDSRYICEVTHEELEKFFDQFYGKMSRLSVGQEVDLGVGYNFATRIESACKSMADASKAFGYAQSVMTDYAIAIAARATTPAPAAVEGGA
jgi:hypothetical protein